MRFEQVHQTRHNTLTSACCSAVNSSCATLSLAIRTLGPILPNVKCRIAANKLTRVAQIFTPIAFERKRRVNTLEVETAPVQNSLKAHEALFCAQNQNKEATETKSVDASITN